MFIAVSFACLEGALEGERIFLTQMKFLDQFKGAGSRVIPDVNDVADDIASVLPVSDGRDSKIKSFHKSSIDRYQRTKDYWDFWDEKYWNPGPFSNRNKNNMFVAFFSLVSHHDDYFFLYLFTSIAIDGC